MREETYYKCIIVKSKGLCLGQQWLSHHPSGKEGRGKKGGGFRYIKCHWAAWWLASGSQISRKAVVFTVFVSWWLWLAPIGFYFWKFGHWEVVYLRGITEFRLSHQQLKPHPVSLSSCFLSLFCSSISACMRPCYVPWKYWIKPQKL